MKIALFIEDIYVILYVVFFYQSSFKDPSFLRLFLAKDKGTPIVGIDALVVIPLSRMEAQISTKLVSFVTWLSSVPCAVQSPI